jgi:hypothetical protein
MIYIVHYLQVPDALIERSMAGLVSTSLVRFNLNQVP